MKRAEIAAMAERYLGKRGVRGKLVNNHVGHLVQFATMVLKQVRFEERTAEEVRDLRERNADATRLLEDPPP